MAALTWSGSLNGAAVLPQRRVRARQPVSRAIGVRAQAAGSGDGLNKYSSRITQPKSQGASQAMLYATGLKEEDMNKAQVGLLGRPAMMRIDSRST